MSTQSLARAVAAAERTPLLRLALLADAAVTGANGVAYLVAAEPIGDLLGLSPGLLRGAGAFLAVFAALVWVAGSRPAVPRRAAEAIVAVNAAWVVGSIAAAIAQWGSPSTAGTAWIVLQAIAVAGFAELQLAGLRRTGAR